MKGDLIKIRRIEMKWEKVAGRGGQGRTGKVKSKLKTHQDTRR